MLVFFDFETTGLSPTEDKIIQFMFLETEGQHYFSSYVNPKCIISPKAVEVTGITNEDVRQYQTIDCYIPKLLRFLTPKAADEAIYLVAHNGDSFDKLFLREALSNFGMEIPSNWFFIDTLKLAQNFLPKLPRHTMNHLRSHFQLSTMNAHLATKDVLDLERIYFFLQEIILNHPGLSKNAKDRKVNELIERYSMDPPLLMYKLSRLISYTLSFGKHKGQFFHHLPLDYLEYLYSIRDSSYIRQNKELSDYLTKLENRA